MTFHIFCHLYLSSHNENQLLFLGNGRWHVLFSGVFACVFLLQDSTGTKEQPVLKHNWLPYWYSIVYPILVTLSGFALYSFPHTGMVLTQNPPHPHLEEKWARNFCWFRWVTFFWAVHLWLKLQRHFEITKVIYESFRVQLKSTVKSVRFACEPPRVSCWNAAVIAMPRWRCPFFLDTHLKVGVCTDWHRMFSPAGILWFM